MVHSQARPVPRRPPAGTETVNPGQTTTTTPGIELVALVGVLGAAPILVRRKL